jgi:chitinase
MKSSVIKIALVLLGSYLIGCQQRPHADKLQNATNKKIIGYIAGWKGVDTSAVQAEKLTHVNYAFANVIDGMVTEGEGRFDQDKVNIQKLHSLKSRNPDLKILISIGGWTWSKGFSDAVLTDDSRKKFTDSAIAYLIRHDLDGLDFDWEYPGMQGDGNVFRAEDKENFVLMLKSVRQALDSLEKVTGKHYLNTIASAGFKSYLEVNDLGQAQQYLDFINIMTYDFVGPGTDTTAHHTNLFNPNLNGRSAAQAVFDHVEAGVPIEKLVMGMAFYGKSWKSVRPGNNGLYQPAVWNSTHPYRNIQSMVGQDGYVRNWDEDSKAPYLWNQSDSIFLSYEDPESIAAKAEFIKTHNLGGAMFWEYHEDSDDGELLNALFQSLRK